MNTEPTQLNRVKAFHKKIQTPASQILMKFPRSLRVSESFDGSASLTAGQAQDRQGAKN